MLVNTGLWTTDLHMHWMTNPNVDSKWVGETDYPNLDIEHTVVGKGDQLGY